MTKPAVLIDRPDAATAATIRRSPVARRTSVRDRLTIARAAVVVAWVLIATAAALGLSALLLHQQAVELDVHGADTGGVLGLLTLGALALLGAVAASVAAVNQQSKRMPGWVSLVASSAALLAVLAATLPLR
ncbi:MAG TPA: hypothetical protein VGM94_03555 [Galbitalea sp.]